MMSTPCDPHPCVAIIGLGLIGGSMAKALSRHGGYRVFGSDLDPAAVAWMQETGAIKGVADTAAMSQADLVVLALPPGACGPVLREILTCCAQAAS